ncbi:E3 SUMO-protein ligase KIAA1586-like [Lingula anatina]|uniref:E3 SUMO-protein ligase KIAA1586-like n=1 Tax=Lingula anatina TaxID=7574 RepID=A0A1S3K1L9_LINAN|nr:E3 SUMO-protein ligase KIAA1586-like [Lingula anatina]|eukprot:XP_013416166.1 E3 SUMO-protein ligase KIAA1586-like [Lingula anatina]
MSDGTTDISVTENEVVYIHFAINGVTHCYFVGMVACAFANAAGIYDAIMTALNATELRLEDIKRRIIGFAGDGASVNTGQISGVIALFRRNISPEIIMVQCMSHRIELSFKDVLSNTPLYKKVYTLMDELYKMYHKSAKQTRGLRASFEALKMWAMPTRVGGTGWLGHTMTALNVIWKGYKAFALHLNEVVSIPSGTSAVQPKAKHLIKLLRSKDVMLFAHFLTDLVAVLVRLSMALQKRQTCIYEVRQELETTTLNIINLHTSPGLNMRRLQAALAVGDKYQGEQLHGQSATYEAQKRKVLDNLVSSLDKQFADIDKGLLSCTSIANLQSWPPTFEDAPDFGNDMLAQVVDHFNNHLQQSVDLAVMDAEWTSLKHDLYEKDLGMERGFSQLKIIRTQLRNKLRASTLTALLTIQLHSAEIAEYDPTPAIHCWNTQKRRRPLFLRSVSRGHCRRPAADEMRYLKAEAEADAAAPDVQKPEDPNLDSDYDSHSESDFSDLGSAHNVSDADSEESVLE